MKIRISMIIDKVVEAPDFMRPYVNKEKEWRKMNPKEVKQYGDWYENVFRENPILDEGEWIVVEEEKLE